MSNETQQNIRAVEVSIEEAQGAAETLAALLRLRDNADFKTVIEDGYFRDEAARVVGLRSEPNILMQDAVALQMVENQITSIGGLRQYFIKIQQIGNLAAQSLAEDQATHAELLTEDGE